MGGPLRFGLRTKIKSLIQLYRKKCNEKASENGGGMKSYFYRGSTWIGELVSLFDQLI